MKKFSAILPMLTAVTFLFAATRVEFYYAFSKEELFNDISNFLELSLFFSMFAAAPLGWLSGKSGKIYGALVIPLALLATSIQIILLAFFMLPIEKSLFSIIYVSSRAETAEFFAEFMSGTPGLVCGISLVLVIAIGLVLYKISGAVNGVSRVIGAFLAVPFLLVSLFYVSIGHPSEILNTTALLRLPLGYYKFQNETRAFSEMAKNPIVPPDIRHATPDNFAGVIVIDESATRREWSLFGYSRPTTPELDRVKNELFLFHNAEARETHTAEALGLAFSLARKGTDRHPGISLCELLRRAGFRVVLLSNQKRWGEFDTPISLLFHSADRAFYLSEDNCLSQRPDKDLLPELQKELATSKQPVIVFLHLMGSHIPFCRRYEPGTGPFAESGPVPDEHRATAPEFHQLVNTYDNTIYFTNKVIGGSLDLLKNSGRPGFFLVFSDHGEAVFPGMTKFTPREPIAACHEIPLAVWLSPEYSAARSDLVVGMRQNAHARIFCDLLFFAICDLSGTQYRGFPQSENPCSTQYIPEPSGTTDAPPAHKNFGASASDKK